MLVFPSPFPFKHLRWENARLMGLLINYLVILSSSTFRIPSSAPITLSRTTSVHDPPTTPTPLAVEMGSSNEEPPHRIRIYVDYFEDHFLQDTEEYYQRESSDFLRLNSVTDYMCKVIPFLLPFFLLPFFLRSVFS